MTQTTQNLDRDAILQALAGNHQITLTDGTRQSLATAVLLDLDGKGITTQPLSSSGVRFDFNADGLADQASWFSPNAGLLFLDRDGNGTLTNAAEFTFSGDLAGAATGLADLAAFDTSGDGALSAADARFGDFRIWQDKNGNGAVDSGEVLTLAAAGIRAIALSSTPYAGANTAGDVLRLGTGSFNRTNAVTGTLIDAAISYYSAAQDGLPKLEAVAQTFDLKSTKYRISSRDGALYIADKDANPALIDSRAGALTGNVAMHFWNGDFGMTTALVLDLDGNGVSLTKLGHSGLFDMTGSGKLDIHGWISGRDGFLVIDRNNNGTIDNGAELSMMAEDPAAHSSLAALAKLDSNGDKIIDRTDARFGELKVWIDANGNGRSDPGELKSLDDLGIASIALDEHFINGPHKIGNNLLIGTATFKRTNGMIGTVGDAALAWRPTDLLAHPAVPARAAATGTAAAALPANLLAQSASQFAAALAAFAPAAGTGELSAVPPGPADWVPTALSAPHA